MIVSRLNIHIHIHNHIFSSDYNPLNSRLWELFFSFYRYYFESKDISFQMPLNTFYLIHQKSFPRNQRDNEKCIPDAKMSRLFEWL